MNQQKRNTQNAWSTECVSSDTIPEYQVGQKGRCYSAYYLPKGMYDADAHSEVTTSLDYLPSDISGDYELEPEPAPYATQIHSGTQGNYAAQQTIKSSVPLNVQAEYEECCRGDCMPVAILNMGLITRWYGIYPPYGPPGRSDDWAASMQPAFPTGYNAKFVNFVPRQGNLTNVKYCHEIIPVDVKNDVGCLEYYIREWHMNANNFANLSWAAISDLPGLP